MRAIKVLTFAPEESQSVLMELEDVDVYPLECFNHVSILTEQRLELRK
jgi:hypothetical protein